MSLSAQMFTITKMYYYYLFYCADMPLTKFSTQVLALTWGQPWIEGCKTPKGDNFLTKTSCCMLRGTC